MPLLSAAILSSLERSGKPLQVVVSRIPLLGLPCRFSSALGKSVLLLVAGPINLESIARHARKECRKLSHTLHLILSLRELLRVDLQRSLLRPWHAGCMGQRPQPRGLKHLLTFQ